MVAAGAGRVDELAAAVGRPGVHVDDDARRRAARGEQRVGGLRERRPEGGAVVPHRHGARVALDDVHRRVAAVRLVVVARRHVDLERALGGVAERVAGELLAHDRVPVEAAGERARERRSGRWTSGWEDRARPRRYRSAAAVGASTAATAGRSDRYQRTVTRNVARSRCSPAALSLARAPRRPPAASCSGWGSSRRDVRRAALRAARPAPCARARRLGRARVQAPAQGARPVDGAGGGGRRQGAAELPLLAPPPLPRPARVRPRVPRLPRALPGRGDLGRVERGQPRRRLHGAPPRRRRARSTTPPCGSARRAGSSAPTCSTARTCSPWVRAFQRAARHPCGSGGCTTTSTPGAGATAGRARCSP